MKVTKNGEFVLENPNPTKMDDHWELTGGYPQLSSTYWDFPTNKPSSERFGDLGVPPWSESPGSQCPPRSLPGWKCRVL